MLSRSSFTRQSDGIASRGAFQRFIIHNPGSGMERKGATEFTAPRNTEAGAQTSLTVHHCGQ